MYPSICIQLELTRAASVLTETMSAQATVVRTKAALSSPATAGMSPMYSASPAILVEWDKH